MSIYPMYYFASDSTIFLEKGHSGRLRHKSEERHVTPDNVNSLLTFKKEKINLSSESLLFTNNETDLLHYPQISE